jgi:hypothetical protein
MIDLKSTSVESGHSDRFESLFESRALHTRLSAWETLAMARLVLLWPQGKAQ